MQIVTRLAGFFLPLVLLLALASAQPTGDQKPAAQPAAAPEKSLADPNDWPQYFRAVEEFWNREFHVTENRVVVLGELLQAVIIFGLVLLAAWIARTIIRRTLLRHLRKHAETSETLLDDSLLAMAEQTKKIVVFIVAAYLALITLPLSSGARWWLGAAAVVVLTAQAAIWANAAISTVLEKTKQRRAAEDPSAASAFGLLGFFAKIAVWSAALLLALSNLGYAIGPLLAGLGVGGIAVAFALQHILTDIFCSIAIVLDKPFVIGDFIIVNDMMGTVENIGIKTTRIRSLGGEQIIFPNADLIGSRVRNYKKMYQRRIVFAFGVVYETPFDQLQQIPHMVRGIIEGIEQTRFDRAHFKDYGDSSLNFEVVYYVTVADFNKYMDIQQQINLRLFESFAKDDIAFAYPTREIIMRPNTA